MGSADTNGKSVPFHSDQEFWHKHSQYIFHMNIYFWWIKLNFRGRYANVSEKAYFTSKLLTHGYRYHKLRKTFGKFFMSYSELLSKFGAISFQEYVSKGITHTTFYGDLVYNLRRVKSESNFISYGLKIVKRLRRRQYDPVIIERTVCLVLGPFTALYRSFLKRCTLTNKMVGTI